MHTFSYIDLERMSGDTKESVTKEFWKNLTAKLVKQLSAPLILWQASFALAISQQLTKGG